MDPVPGQPENSPASKKEVIRRRTRLSILRALVDLEFINKTMREVYAWTVTMGH